MSPRKLPAPRSSLLALRLGLGLACSLPGIVAGQSSAPLLGDFDGDGRTELLWRNTQSSLICAWTTTGGFQPFGTEAAGWQVIGQGDFDGDGRTELLWRNAQSSLICTWTAAGAYLYLGTESPDWQVIGLGDLDGDGRAELLWRNTPNSLICSWTQTGVFLHLGTENAGWAVIGLGDFDGDGRAELLWRNTQSGLICTWTMAGVFMNLGSESADWQVIGLGDFDGDGRAELLWRNTLSNLVCTWTTTNTFLVFGTTTGGWEVIGQGDFDGDGRTELVWRNNQTGLICAWTQAGAFLNLGAETAGWQTVPPNNFNAGGIDPVPVTAKDDGEAARFLVQASFGPNAAAIAHVRATGYAGWIDEQVALAPTYHLPYFHTRVAELVARDGNDGYFTPRQEAWWQHALTAPDQLRQRMAFALSEILVISQDSALSNEQEGTTAYYDLLVGQAFGNYRQLLEKVTLSPMMGTYLSMIRNQKPDPNTGSQPDENYAREIMQLFSIGLSQLNMDGTLQLGAGGRSIPTYTQDDIVGLAHVFTGWGPHYDPANPPKWDDGSTASADDWFLWGWDPLQPMTFNANFGDFQSQPIVGGVTVPGTLTGPARLTRALDTLFNHPNLAPFLSRQLIQRFVTSNPSPAYVGRVAAVFANNGAGVRGDLGATLRAVLLDPEARRPESLASTFFGKPVEPLLRLTRMFRAFPPVPPPHAATGDNRLFLNFVWNMEEQSPLMSPTVFNFFKPGYAQPGPITAAGLVSPEFQIIADTTIIQGVNRHFGFINWGIWVDEPSAGNDNSSMDLDLSEPLAILTATGRSHADAQAALADYFNQRLLAGHMSDFLRQKLLDTYTSLPKWFDYSAASELERVQLGLYLVMFSPEFNIQH